MHHRDVLQRLLDLKDRPRYLEIGVGKGETFHALRAAAKVAVDPLFLFDLDAARAAAGEGVRYHACTSDAFFAAPADSEERFDLIFLDGLHTFDQTLRDLFNALAQLAPGGLIVIDDVLPDSYAASLPSLDDWRKLRRMQPGTGAGWMGDVFRLVFFLRDYLPMLSYATVEEGLGQTIIWSAPRMPDVAPLAVEAIARLEYKDVVFRPRAYNFRPFAAIEADIRGWLAGGVTGGAG